MGVSSVLAKDYENKTDTTLGENKPNQTQTNPIRRTPKMNANLIMTKDYENICPCRAPKNKPKTNPIC